MQLKTADHKYTNVLEPICIREDVTIPPNNRHLVLMASQLYEDTEITGLLQPSNTLTDDGNFVVCAALVTLTIGHVEVQLNNLIDTPLYSQKRYASCKFHCPSPGTDKICHTHRSGDHVAPIAG